MYTKYLKKYEHKVTKIREEQTFGASSPYQT